MDEIKNMLDYKVGHYIKYEDISQSNKKNILRSFMLHYQRPWVHQTININRINTQLLLQSHWRQKPQPSKPGLTVKCCCLSFGVTDIM